MSSPQIGTSYRQIASYSDNWWAFDVRQERPTPVEYGENSDVLDVASTTLLRAAAFETGAIEDLYDARPGATLTVAQEKPGWEEVLDEAGSDARHHYRDQLEAYEWAREYASESNPSYPISEVLLREAHKMACRHQKVFGNPARPLAHGQYKKLDNYVLDRFGRVRSYAPAHTVASELRTAFSFWESMKQRGAPATILSAYLHWAITHIHPFEDGNGRVARIVSSLPLLRVYGIPIIVFSDQKRAYLQALDAADFAEVESMIDYTEDRMRQLEVWRTQLIEGGLVAEIESSRALVEKILAAQVEKREPLDDVLLRVLHAMEGALISKLSWISDLDGGHVSEADFMAPNGSTETVSSVRIRLTSSIDDFTDSVHLRVASASQSAIEIGQLASGSPVRLQFVDCSPVLTTEASMRIEAWAEYNARRVGGTLRWRLSDAAKALGTMPYSEAE